VNRILLILLALSVALAGCAADDGGNGGNGDGGDGGDGGGTTMSNAEAQALLLGSSSDMPERFGFAFRAVADNGTELLTFEGAVDDASQRAYVRIQGDPAALGEAGDEESAAFFEQGFAIYSTPESSLYILNGTAFVFPPGEETSGFVPRPEESPVGAFLDPSDLLSNFSDSGVNVTSVRATTYRGQAAVEIGFTMQDEDEEGGASTGKAILFAQSKRIARMEVERTGGLQATPLDQARFEGDFYYDNEVQTQVPVEAARALALAYDSDADPFDFGGGNDDEETTETWTFLVSGGIPLAEVELLAKAAGAGASDGLDLAATPTLWSMSLADGTATHDGVTVTYNDNDGDGKVSQGDTLVIVTAADAETPSLVLRDTVTGLHVVPGVGALALVALVGALALALRRRG
jgi:hypothetical protein